MPGMPLCARIGVGPDQGLERHPLRIEHAQQVVVGLEQQRGRIAERRIQREPCRIGMAVGADDRQVGHLDIELARQRPHAGIGREQAVWVQFELAGQRFPPPGCVSSGLIAMIALTGGEFQA